MAETTLYERLGGYDAISAVANNLLPRLISDPLLARFWKSRVQTALKERRSSL